MVVASSSAITLEKFVSLGGRHFGTDAGTARPGYLTTATSWDGQWYWEIAAHGYPFELPTDGSGHVQQNAWAFFPLYPYLVRGVMFVTRLDFPIAAVGVSLACGAIAMLLAYRIAHRRYGHVGGILGVVGLSTFICSPVFQIAYAEGLALALLLGALLATLTKRYAVAAALLLLLALTRGVAAPLVPTFLLYGAYLWRRGLLARRDAIGLLSLSAVAACLTFAWVGIAALVTGRPDAYVATQKAWNPELTVVPVIRFIDRNSDVVGGTAGAAVIVAVWATFLIWFLTKGQKEPLLAIWSGMYVAYLLAVTDWNWSNVRYYLLALPVLWPLLRPSAGERSPSQRIAIYALVGVLGLAAQWWYIRYCMTVSPQLVQVP
ncbi:hypothetical protein TAE01_36860 [Terrabacter aerolatus]|uniref:Glycosyltransferase RgtA/B/C/D-like domain-containing protein n=2 Tax=Terrabacter aerolatus TaxID=422442 RepID=A0A512D5X2_9MICO|nr:hypothetical protein TAE01_36860 [Terrabacter aerolatus]